jgi:ferredoxin-thioredoxin reductase catalytic subunit
MPKPKRKKTKEQAKKFVEMVAEKQDWALHPDDEFLDMLIVGLMENYNRYGYYACPCRLSSGNKEKDEDIICPCDYCVPDQKEYGHCYCGLYCLKEFVEEGNIPEGIPERRPDSKLL